MSKYVVVSFLEENPPHEFSSEEWPLHVTLVRPFETALSQEEILFVLQKTCDTHSVVTTQGISQEMFGPNRDVQVTELDAVPELQALHDDLHELFGEKIQIIPPLYVDFRPHVSVSPGKKIGVGDSVKIQEVALVTYDNKRRKIIDRLTLTK